MNVRRAARMTVRVMTTETEMPVVPETESQLPTSAWRRLCRRSAPGRRGGQAARVNDWPGRALVPGFEPLLHLGDLALLRSDDLGRQLDHLRLLGLRLGKLGRGDR